MVATRWRNWLITTSNKPSVAQVSFWFWLSLSFAAIYGILGLQQAFSSEYVVQDDARQHVFWMQRFIDPELFPNDLIADYFQSVAPWGYTSLYRLFALIGIEPILLSKLLPLALGLITTGYGFFVCLHLLPVPLAGFLSTLLLNQYLWMRDDLISATAVAFVYPLLMVFLYALLQRSLIATGIAIALLGLCYPQAVFICAGVLILRLLQWRDGRLALSENSMDYRIATVGLGVFIGVMLLYALKSSNYGPVISAAEARQLPEFLPNGMSKFFVDNPWHYWFTGQRSGMMPRFGTVVPLVGAALFPFVLLVRRRFPLVEQLTQETQLLLQMVLASLGMFLISHALLFKLHLPSRYTEHSLRIVTAIAAGIALTAILDTLLRWTATGQKTSWIPLSITVLLLVFLVIHPSFTKGFPKTQYVIGKTPALYQFLAKQPKDSLIASLADEANNLPSFANRSILVGGEGYPVPYHKGYYAKIRQRTIDLIQAQYSSELSQVQAFIRQYGVDFWLLEKTAFLPQYLSGNRWMMQYQPTANTAIARLEQGIAPALTQVSDRCAVFATENFVVLKANCILDEPSNGKVSP